VPIVDDRSVWLGPFVSFTDIYQANTIGFNSNDAYLATIGLSLEFGGGNKPASQPVAAECPKCTQGVVAPTPALVEKRVEYIETIQFAVNSTKLDATAASQLHDVVSDLSKATHYDRIDVEGHASSDGPADGNNKLAQERAASVKSFLVAEGLPAEKITAVGFGSSKPITSNKTLSGRVQNRRASFVVKFVVVSKESK
jgi:outer membrane protein OmpA-like peptidoglycan-associated protein